MKITRRQLRRLILQEVRIKPSVTNIPPQYLDKIHSLINSGEIEQAQTFIDAFGGDPDYAYNHSEYEKVGDLEKLGNETAAILSDPEYRKMFGYPHEMDNRAGELARTKIDQFEWESDEWIDAFDTNYNDRYMANVLKYDRSKQRVKKNRFNSQ